MLYGILIILIIVGRTSIYIYICMCVCVCVYIYGITQLYYSRAYLSTIFRNEVAHEAAHFYELSPFQTGE